MRSLALAAVLHCCNAFSLRVQPHTAYTLRTAPVICASGDELKVERTDEQKEALRQIAQDFFPAEGGKDAVVRDISSPFAYGKVRTDFPCLKDFSDAELYEGMGDFVVPREPVEMPPVPLEARVYQVLIPLSVIYLAINFIQPDLLPFPGGEGKA